MFEIPERICIFASKNQMIPIMANKLKPAQKTAVEKTGVCLSVQEQQELNEKSYNEAIRYMDNAKGYLKQAQKEGNFYRDIKYVKTACGTAYSGVLVALDGFLQSKGIHTPDNRKVRKSVEYYQNNLAKLDKKMLDYLISAYKILHLYGYYDGINNVTVVKEGFATAKIIIDKIKPARLNGAPKKTAEPVKSTASRNGKAKK